jgi:urea transport system ATP-binding protein
METPILNVQNVTVSFDGFKVLDNLNFAMDTGELRFLIGPNGAGKTTLLDIVTGKTRASSGRVVYDGNQDITRRQEHHRVRLGISRKFQTPSGFWRTWRRQQGFAPLICAACLEFSAST